MRRQGNRRLQDGSGMRGAGDEGSRGRGEQGHPWGLSAAPPAQAHGRERSSLAYSSVLMGAG